MGGSATAAPKVAAGIVRRDPVTRLVLTSLWEPAMQPIHDRLTLLLRAYRTIDFCDTCLALRLPMHLAKILGGLRRGRGHRTNLCTTRTRPRRDLSVTWPS